jgi:hypothetical protein
MSPRYQAGRGGTKPSAHRSLVWAVAQGAFRRYPVKSVGAVSFSLSLSLSFPDGLFLYNVLIFVKIWKLLLKNYDKVPTSTLA